MHLVEASRDAGPEIRTALAEVAGGCEYSLGRNSRFDAELDPTHLATVRQLSATDNGLGAEGGACTLAARRLGRAFVLSAQAEPAAKQEEASEAGQGIS